MNEERKALIADLVGDLKPVTNPGKTERNAFRWLLACGAYSVAVTAATGPFRDHALAAVLASPVRMLEVGLALAAIVLLARAALRTAIPAGVSWRRDLAWPLLALGAWGMLLVAGSIGDSPGAPETLGKREHCFWQAVLFGVPSGALLMVVARSYLPLWPRATGALAGAAAAAVPALLMQLACMDEPGHALAYHWSAIPAGAAIGALIGPRVLLTRRAVPRTRGGALH